MVSVETISIVFTGLSVSLAAFYYISTLRNAQKTQEMQLETRQTQIFMQIYQQLNSEESFTSWAEIMNLEVEDYDEFLQKYDSSVNPANYGKRAHIWWSLNSIGVLLQEGLIDADIVHRILGPMAVMQWEKWVDIINKTKAREKLPDIWEGFEYLYNEMKRIRKERNYPEIEYGQPNRNIQ